RGSTGPPPPPPLNLPPAIGPGGPPPATGVGHLADNQVLNGCRSVTFCRTGRWVAKRQSAQLISTSEPKFRPLLEAAVHSFERPRAAALELPAADVRTFLAWVRERVEDATESTGHRNEG
ncbi:aminoglycoside adenylyltransferase domain-containing protein, partial [Nocardia brasiliensis]|uniref:aminoglycoside adenylyltransferase domain-containing protein n=1 Tax=Nocardia brasiliensis TaxID=37326 RepID=UPI002458B9DE